MKSTESLARIITKKRLYHLYVVDLVSARSIAKLLSCSNTTINNYIKKYGITDGLSDNKREQIKQKRVKERTIVKNSPQSKLKQSISMKKAYVNNPKLRENHSKDMIGYWDNHPEEIQEITKNLLVGLKESWESTEGRKKRMDIINSQNYKEKWRLAMEEMYKNNPQLIENISMNFKKMWENPEYREKKVKELLAQRNKAWANPEKRKQWIANVLKGTRIRPTSIEQTVIDVINEYNLPYKYVGNGEVIIEGKNPDFINVNGLKSVIEVYGRYWHQIEDEPERIEFFGRYGFRTLILWDREIENVPHEEIYQKILKFTEECMVEFRKSHPIVTA